MEPPEWRRACTNFAKNVAKVASKANPWETFAVIFFCQNDLPAESKHQHTPCDGFEGLVHAPFIIKGILYLFHYAQ